MQNQQVQQLWVSSVFACIEVSFLIVMLGDFTFVLTYFDSLSLLHCVVSMSGMMSNAVGGPAAGVGGLSDISSLIEA